MDKTYMDLKCEPFYIMKKFSYNDLPNRISLL